MANIIASTKPAAQQPPIIPKPAAPKVAQSDSVDSKDSVQISGHAMLLSRLFNTDNPNAEIPVAKTQGMEGVLFTAFLTKDDRKMLESAYQYASANGIDPRYVDDLAHDLALYRQGPNDKDGLAADLEGHQLTYEFGPSDAKIADRILNGDAINQTSIDRGFLSFVLKPGSAPLHAVSFEFLEKMVSVFSTSSGAPTPEAGGDLKAFASYAFPKNDYITHVSKEVVFPKWVPDPAGEADALAGIDLKGMLTDSTKKTLTQAIVEILFHPTEKTVAHIVDLAAVLNMPQSIPEATPLEIVKSLGAFLADKK